MARRASRLSLTGVEPIPVAEEAAVEAIPPILEVPTHEGYIRKSHAGGNFLKKNVRRWCVAKGFNIIYYNTKEKNGIVEKDLNTVKGHFDLRNVIKAEAVSDGVDDDAAIKVSILEPNRPADQPPKEITMSFARHDERAKWLEYLCSGIDRAAIDDDVLATFIDDDLAERLNAACHNQKAVSAYRFMDFLFKNQPTTTEVISKREGSVIEYTLEHAKRRASAVGTAPPPDKISWETSYHKEEEPETDHNRRRSSIRGSIQLADGSRKSEVRRASVGFVGAPPSLMQYDSVAEMAVGDDEHKSKWEGDGPWAGSSADKKLPPRRQSIKSGHTALKVLESNGASLDTWGEAEEACDKKLFVHQKEEKRRASTTPAQADKELRRKSIQTAKAMAKDDEPVAATSKESKLNKLAHALDASVEIPKIKQNKSGTDWLSAHLQKSEKEEAVVERRGSAVRRASVQQSAAGAIPAASVETSTPRRRASVNIQKQIAAHVGEAADAPLKQARSRLKSLVDDFGGRVEDKEVAKARVVVDAAVTAVEKAKLAKSQLAAAIAEAGETFDVSGDLRIHASKAAEAVKEAEALAPMLPALLSAQEPCGYQLQDLLDMRMDGRLDEIIAPVSGDVKAMAAAAAPPPPPRNLLEKLGASALSLVGVKAPKPDDQVTHTPRQHSSAL